MQLKTLQMVIAQGDFERAKQIIQNLSNYAMPPEVVEEWGELVILLNKELDAQEAASMEKWRKDVDQLVSDAHKACIEAKEVADLDTVLIRCAALQMQRQQQNNVLGERVYYKLSGTAETLERWAKYLDYKSAGSTKSANEMLRNMESTGQFPLLTKEEVSAAYLPPGPAQMTIREAWPKIFENVNAPDDIPLAIQRIKVLSEEPQNPELSTLKEEINRLSLLATAWNAVKSRDEIGAAQAMSRISNSGGFSDAERWEFPLQKQINGQWIEQRAGQWSKLTRQVDEDPLAYIQRIIKEQWDAGNYETVVEIMKFSDKLNRSGQQQFTGRAFIEQYLAGQRFEATGDDLAAIVIYRAVVAAPAGEFVPTEKAQEALKRLQAKNPEAFKDYEGVVLQELSNIKKQMQILMNRSPMGRPNPY